VAALQQYLTFTAVLQQHSSGVKAAAALQHHGSNTASVAVPQQYCSISYNISSTAATAGKGETFNSMNLYTPKMYLR
jgi:hypothetical protein